MILVPDTCRPSSTARTIAPHLTAGKTLMFAHGFNIRFGQIVPPPDVDVSMIAPKVAGAPRARAVPGRRRGARPPGRAPGRQRPRQGAGPGLRQGARLHPRRRHRDHIRRRDRDRPVRRAGGAVRRRHAHDRGRLQHPGRGRLPAGDRLLRVPARAQAHRRPHLPGRPELHALLGQRHGRARRLLRRAQGHRRSRQGDDEEAAGRHPVRRLRQGVDRGEREGPPVVQRPARSHRAPDRAGGPDCAA